MKYIHYIENETENKLFKSCYECIKDDLQLGRNGKLTVDSNGKTTIRVYKD